MTSQVPVGLSSRPRVSGWHQSYGQKCRADAGGFLLVLRGLGHFQSLIRDENL
jgi:hypothetical protein